MNSLKGIRDDIEKSTLISKKVLGKIVELIGENTYQLLEDEHSDIMTTIGEVAISVDSLEYLEKENEQLKARVKKMKNCWNCKYYNVGETTCLKGKPHNSGGCFKDWELAE